MEPIGEHLDFCRLLGVPRGLVVLTKIDMVEEEWLGLVIEEVREYLAESFLEGAAIVPASSRTGDAVEDLPSGRTERVRGIQACGRKEEQGEIAPPGSAT